MLENTPKNVPYIIKYLSYLFLIVDILFVPTLFFLYLFVFGLAKEAGEYLATFYIALIDLAIYWLSLKILNYANKRDFTFIFILFFWIIIELLTFSLAFYIYFIDKPEIQYRIIESIYDTELFTHYEAKAYFYIIGILILQSLKILLMAREIIYYFKKKN